jgi:hypothetical protein
LPSAKAFDILDITPSVYPHSPRITGHVGVTVFSASAHVMDEREKSTGQARAAERLEATFRARRQQGVSDGQLRSEVCRFVDDAKLSGMRAEAAVIAIKHVAAEAQLMPYMPAASPGGAAMRRELVVGQAVTWCIQHYYGLPSEAAALHSADGENGMLRRSTTELVMRAADFSARYEKVGIARAAIAKRRDAAVLAARQTVDAVAGAAAKRADDREDRLLVRQAVRDYVQELKAMKVPGLDIVLALSEIAGVIGENEATKTGIQRQIVDWALEALNAA